MDSKDLITDFIGSDLPDSNSEPIPTFPIEPEPVPDFSMPIARNWEAGRPILPQCYICGRSFTSISSLERHFKGSHGLSPEEASKKVQQQIQVQAQAAKAIGMDPNPCSCTDSRSTFKVDLTCPKHRPRLELGLDKSSKSDQVIFEFTCHFCDQRYPTMKTFTDHSKSHFENSKESSSSNSQKCSLCGKVFKNEKGLQHHMTLIHENEEPFSRFRCLLCAKNFQTREKLSMHKRKIHQRINFEKFYMKTHPCKLCAKLFTSLTRLRNHMKDSHERVLHDKMSEPYRCEYCAEEFEFAFRLKQHVEKNHHVSPVIQTKFDEIQETQKHHVLPEKEADRNDFHGLRSKPQPFKCDACQLSLPSKSAFDQHWDQVHGF